MKQTLRGVLAVVVIIGIMFSLIACAPKETDPTKPTGGGDATQPSESQGTGLIAEGKKLAYITTMGGLGDGAIGDACYEGILEAQKVLGFEFDYSEPLTPVDTESLLIEYAESGEYDLIFTAAFEALDPLNTVAPDFPDQKFLIYDIEAGGNDQYISLYFAKNQIGFMGGVLAALMEEKGEITVGGKTTSFEPAGKVGLIIGVEVPTTVNSITGAAAGVKYIRPDYEYLYGIVGDWRDQAKNKEVALSMYDEGVHLIFANPGGGGLGIIAAGKERERFFIGYDKDQTDWDPERVIASSMKMNTDSIVRVLTQFFETGALPWGEAVENNASNEGIGFAFNPDFVVPDDVAQILQDVMNDLASGKIKAPNTWEEVESFNDVYNR